MLDNTYLSVLTVDDIPDLEIIEDETKLTFWGEENYRRFLEASPEYFGGKAVLLEKLGGRRMAGFYLARSVLEQLEILKVGVAPEFQGCGIGTSLLESAFAEGIRRGCTRCFLEVRKSNEKAIRFYHNHRFRIATSRRDYYRDPIEDAWVMERYL